MESLKEAQLDTYGHIVESSKGIHFCAPQPEIFVAFRQVRLLQVGLVFFSTLATYLLTGISI